MSSPGIVPHTCTHAESKGLFTNFERMALTVGCTAAGTVLLTLVVVGCCYCACKRQQQRNQITPAEGGTGTPEAVPRAPPAALIDNAGRPMAYGRSESLPPLRDRSQPLPPIQDQNPVYLGGGLNHHLATLPPSGQEQVYDPNEPPPDYPGAYSYNGTQL